MLLAAVAAVPVGTVAAASAPLPPPSGHAGERWPRADGGSHRSWPGDTPGDRILPTATGGPAAGRSPRGTFARGGFAPTTSAPAGSGGPAPGAGSRGGGADGGASGMPAWVMSPAHGSWPTGSGRDSGPVGPRSDGSVPVRFGQDGSPSGRSAPAGAGSDRSGPGRGARDCGGHGGPYQRRVERWLRLREDGKQSAADCRAVRAFQKRHGVEPADGTPGAATWARMRALSADAGARTLPGCPVRSYRVACVDLTHQRTWVQQRGRILFGPVPMRSGGVRHPTRTGWFRIYWRHRYHWSTLYNSPMPYAQFFSGGQAFHAVRGSIRTRGGSMGCVNLRLADARGLWKVLRKGDHVYVWGRRHHG